MEAEETILLAVLLEKLTDRLAPGAMLPSMAISENSATYLLFLPSASCIPPIILHLVRRAPPEPTQHIDR